MDDALPDDLINATAAARLAKCHISALHRWRMKGRLRGWRRVGRWHFSRREVLALFEHPQEPPRLPSPTQQQREEADRRRRAEAATAELRRRGWPV